VYPIVPASFRPWSFHFDAAGSDRLLGARFHSVQCVKTRPGASGSTISNANDRVPRGADVQRSGGETFLPLHV